MSKSILHLLTECPLCGKMYYRGVEGKSDGSSCFECMEEPKVDDWDDPNESNP
jgi:hypothetical protein